MAGFLHCTLETRWLGWQFLNGLKKQETTRNNQRLGAGFISVCLETRWLVHFGGFYVPGCYCRRELSSESFGALRVCVWVHVDV